MAPRACSGFRYPQVARMLRVHVEDLLVNDDREVSHFGARAVPGHADPIWKKHFEKNSLPLFADRQHVV